MTRADLESVKHRLPSPERDTLSLPDLMQNADRLVTNYGFQKTIVYYQPVLIGKRFVELPVYAYLSPKQGDAVHYISGVHGKWEKSGPIALSQSVDFLGLKGATHPIVIIPSLNYDGYINTLRYPNIPRKTQNRSSVGDFDTFVLIDEISEQKPRKNKPYIPYINDIAEGLFAIFKTHPPIILLDIHNDYSGTPLLFHSTGPLKEHDPVGHFFVTFAQNELGLDFAHVFNPKKADREERNGLFSNGLVSVKDGSLEDFYVSSLVLRQGNISRGPRANVAIATEIPTLLNGQKFDLPQQIKNQLALIETFDKMLQTYEENLQFYSRARQSILP